MYTVRGYSHPDLAPQVAKSTTDSCSNDNDQHYYPPTPPSSTSPKLNTTTKLPPPPPPPVVAPSQGLSSLVPFKSPMTKSKTHSKLEWHPLPKFAGIDHSEQRINISKYKTWIKDIMMWKQPLHSWLIMAGCMTLAATLSSGEHALIMYHWMRMTGLTVWTLAICQNITRQKDNNAPCLLDALGANDDTLRMNNQVRAQVKATALAHDPGHEMIMAGILHYVSIESFWVMAILFCFITTKIISAKCDKKDDGHGT
ncbi:hypothetical protein K492DRAFT_206327 [Lichtheimia hyalospora FSU 10163]|nr:hypothetical protein K492DRAFT_206327 [Lichtheimia hyalospora FSU 10163]